MTATIALRPYQQDAHDAVITQYLGGTRRTLIVLPTGASTKNIDPNESPPFAAPWLLDGFGDEAGNDRFTA